jgi:malate synthase
VLVGTIAEPDRTLAERSTVTARPIAVVTAADPATDVLTPDVLALVGALQRAHGPGLRLLLEARGAMARSLREGGQLGLDPAGAEIRAGTWRVASPPADLRDRRVEITGPADRKMMVSALASGARVFMADLEDSMSPTWTNVVEGHRNLRDAALGELSFARPDGAVDEVPETAATLTVRPRGLHLTESHVLVDEQPVAAALFDAAVVALHTAAARSAAGSGLYLYLPKLESDHEAEWWEAVLADIEHRLGLAPSSIRVTVLIETIPAAFAMDEILYALRDRITGLNAGRWDYLFSFIKLLGHAPDHVLPDRKAVTMTVPFMAAYAERLVAVCHRRGAHAIGGMSAFVPNRRDPAATETALAQVRADKEREVRLGYDGTWVAHPDLVAVATEVFDTALGAGADQLVVVPPVTDDVGALLMTEIPGAAVTDAGLVANVSVALRYLEAWLGGRGAVAIDGLMEDAATAEIARSQLWQWIQHGVLTADGTTVTVEVVAAAIDAEVARLRTGGDDERVDLAAGLLRDVTLVADLPPFLTTVAAPLLGP